MLDCHVLKGFGIYMIGALGSLSDVVGGFSCTSFTHHVIHSLIYKVLSQPFFLFLPPTRLPHPNTMYRYIKPSVGSGVLASELCKSRSKGTTYTFCESGGTHKRFRWPSGDRITE